MRRVPALLALVGPLAFGPPAAATTYHLTDLGTLNGSYCAGYIGRNSFATAVNDRGQAAGGSCAVVGFSQVTHGFLWSVGAITDVGTLGLTTPEHSVVNGMNNAGRLVGQSSISPQSEGTAFLWSGGLLTNLGPVLGDFSAGLDINNAGQVVGYRGTLPDTSRYAAFVYDTGSGEVTPLPGLGGTFRIAATAIDDGGGIAGWSSTLENDSVFHAVRWIGGVPLDLGTLGGTHSFGYGINAAAEVVGVSSTADGDSHAFVYRGGTMHDLGTLGGATSRAAGINDAGLVVGWASTATGDQHAFLHDGVAMRDLNDLIPPGSGWVLVQASAINASGEIVGTGRIGGEQHAFVLTPGQSFFTVTPCRVVDTRSLATGGPALDADTDRTFTLAGRCGIPAGARAVSVNLAVTGSTSAGNLRAYPGGAPPPLASAINYSAGQTRGNNAVLGLGVDGDLTLRCSQAAGTVHAIIDVNGYFQVGP